MKIQIDLKSAVCGLIIGVAAMFALGNGTSSEDVGRYRIVTNFNGTPGSAYALIVDTVTGKVWGANIGAGNFHNDSNFYNAKNE